MKIILFQCYTYVCIVFSLFTVSVNLAVLPSHLHIQKYVEIKEIKYGNNYSLF